MVKRRSSVADAVTPSAEVEIDGQAFRLVYDFNAIADAESAAGCNLLHGLSATMLNTMNAAQLRGLFWAALRRHHPGITVQRAGELIRLDTMPQIIEGIGQAFVLAMPKKENPTPAAGGAAGTI